MPTLLLIAAILFLKATGNGQVVDDPGIIDRERAAFKLTNTYPDSAIAIAVKDLQQSERTGNRREAAYCYKTKGWAFLRLGNFKVTQ